ncbi:MAG TPA: helix-turn-helix transcriptional regulator [Allosphingosinicella sp.]|jgi:transcriptional regulator with XRE-family HTH domain
MNPAQNPNRIADRLKAHRAARALTQEDLAAQAGIGVATLQRAERGARLSADTIASLAAALDLDARELTGAEDGGDSRAYVPLEPVSTGRHVLALLASADRLDFSFAEIDDLDSAALIESLHAFCSPLGAERLPSGPLARVKQELDARELLETLTASGLIVTGSSYTLNCHEVDDDCGAGMPILLATWIDRVAVLRVGTKGIGIDRAFPTDDLDRWESPGEGFVFPPQPADDTAQDDTEALA